MKCIGLIATLLISSIGFGQTVTALDQSLNPCVEHVNQRLDGLNLEDAKIAIGVDGKLRIDKKSGSDKNKNEQDNWQRVEVKPSYEIPIKSKFSAANFSAPNSLVKIFTDYKSRILGLQFLHYAHSSDPNSLEGPEFQFAYDKEGRCSIERDISVSFETGTRTLDLLLYDNTVAAIACLVPRYGYCSSEYPASPELAGRPCWCSLPDGPVTGVYAASRLYPLSATKKSAATAR